MGRVKGGTESRSKWQKNKWQQEVHEALSDIRKVRSVPPMRKRPNYGRVIAALLSRQHAIDPISPPEVKQEGVFFGQAYKLAKAKRKATLLEALVTSESDLMLHAMHSIAEHIHLYDTGYLQATLMSLFHPMYKPLCALCCLKGTMDDEILLKLADCYADVLIIGESITERGLLTALYNDSKELRNICTAESWEDIELAEELSLSCSFHLKELYFIDSSISLTTLLEAVKYTSGVEILYLHNLRMTAKCGVFPTEVMEELVRSLRSLEHLEVSFCEWLTFEVLVSWVQYLLRNDVDTRLSTLVVLSSPFLVEKHSVGLEELRREMLLRAKRIELRVLEA